MEMMALVIGFIGMLLWVNGCHEAEWLRSLATLPGSRHTLLLLGDRV
jgi:hypothetical protein